MRIAGLMPLASASNLAPVLDLAEGRVRGMLNGLRRGDWMTSVRRGMTEPMQHRWFLTRKAVELLYATDHQHPTPREEARAEARVWSGREPAATAELGRRFALDHDHPAHRESQSGSPFVSAGPPGPGFVGGPGHEHPPWTATARGVETALRRLAMLESVYRLAPELLRSGRVRWPDDGGSSVHHPGMTDFRLLRHGGFYHAVARYGDRVWAPFTYAGLHATGTVLRRKRDHRFWGVGCYSHREDRYLRIANQVFYENPDLEVEPSVRVVVAADAWALELARRHLGSSEPTVICSADRMDLGGDDAVVELRPSRDLVADPAGHPTLGMPERVGRWLRANPDVAVINGRMAYRLFAAIAQFPAMRATWLKETVGGTAGEVNRRLSDFVGAGLVAVFDRRYYLDQLGMKRAANLSRVLPAVIRSRHGAYLTQRYREHELRHNDGVNRLAVRFAKEGVAAVAGWRGEVNLPDITQVRPDLLVPVAAGPFGPGAHYIEFERSAQWPRDVNRKLGPYRRMSQAGRSLPLLVVCERERGEENFRAAGSGLPLLTTTVARARAGPLTGAATVWRDSAGRPVALHCR